MQINDTIQTKKPATVNAAPSSSGKTVEKADVSAPAVDAKVATPDNVSLSTQARELAVSTTSTFDSKKVSEIKAAIANGTFKVDASKIAAGLIDSVKELNQRNR